MPWKHVQADLMATTVQSEGEGHWVSLSEHPLECLLQLKNF